MVQVTESVGTAQNGSMKAVAGSGMASMSEASMDFQPRIEEPSNPKPSSKTSSVSSDMGTLKCCQVPNVSTNFTSTILAPCFFASAMTPLGVVFGLAFSAIVLGVLLVSIGQHLRSTHCDQGTKLLNSSLKRRVRPFLPFGSELHLPPC